MNRAFVSVVASLLLFLSLMLGNVAQAQPFFAVEDASAAKQAVIEQLKTKIMPEIENILTPEQSEQLETAIVDGQKSLKKAFKSLALTPAQKTKLASVFKSLPAKEVFTSMAPDEKKSFFLKQKSAFMPTPEEIGAKINSKLKAAKDKGSLAPSASEITDKISEKLKLAKEAISPD